MSRHREPTTINLHQDSVLSVRPECISLPLHVTDRQPPQRIQVFDVSNHSTQRIVLCGTRGSNARQKFSRDVQPRPRLSNYIQRDILVGDDTEVNSPWTQSILQEWVELVGFLPQHLWHRLFTP